MSEELDDILEIKPDNKENHLVGRKYPALRIIATIYKVLAYICLVGGCIGVIVGLGIGTESRGNFGSYSYGLPFGFIIIIFSIIVGVIGFISLLAASESTKLFIDMEENTRLTNDFLRKLTNKSNT